MALPGSSLPTREGRRRKLLGWASVWPPGKGGKGVGEWAFGPERGGVPPFFTTVLFYFLFPNKTPILIYLKIQTSFKLLIYSRNL
jgi:hypothetical protein